MGSMCGKPAGVECVPYPQCGCTGTDTCTVNSNGDAFGCVSSGSLPRGAACTQNGSCQTGLACFDQECLAFCGSDGGGCLAGEVCAQESSSLGAFVCVPTCNPLANGCDGGQNCDLPADINNVPICVTPGGISLDSGCNTNVPSDRCLGSLICSPVGCKIPYPVDSTCDGGAEVVQIGTQNFGYCP